MRFKGLCCLRNEKITLHNIMFPWLVLPSQIWQVLTLVPCCSPHQAEGVIWSHAHAEAFVKLQKGLFSYYSPVFSLKYKQDTEYLLYLGSPEQPACPHEALFLVQLPC